MHQAIDATTGHAEASSSPTLEQQNEMVDLETNLFTTQTSVTMENWISCYHHHTVGDLSAAGRWKPAR